MRCCGATYRRRSPTSRKNAVIPAKGWERRHAGEKGGIQSGKILDPRFRGDDGILWITD